ncbi:hypothetical protein [Actinoplanes utahensis]|uniref:Uncharacterized protein n=1 Tax=Actinoplanes utahensis TaxID=1869 RepID=A0A0A6UG76_ACTUT|nr:hypothetical protein [Actinoplanes utahensis]KHD74461.1 hypothetical protein MB27_28480 [Actinoplanes utahensis]
MDSHTEATSQAQPAPRERVELAGLNPPEPTDEERAWFAQWYADGNARHAEWAATRTPHAA